MAMELQTTKLMLIRKEEESLWPCVFSKYDITWGTQYSNTQIALSFYRRRHHSSFLFT